MRRPYSTQARMFRNSDELVDFIWYPALPTAPPLPFPSIFLDPIWQENYYEVDDGPGLVIEPNIKPNWEGYRVLGAGLHQCGTATDFAEGGIYDPDLPPVPYREDWLPFCCGGEERAATGGAAMGGHVTPIVYVPCCPGIPMPSELTMVLVSAACPSLNRVVTLTASFINIPVDGSTRPMWYAPTGNGKWWLVHCFSGIWYQLDIYNDDPTTTPSSPFPVCGGVGALTKNSCEPLDLTYFVNANPALFGIPGCLGLSCPNPTDLSIHIFP